MELRDVEITKSQIALANERARQLQAAHPKAVDAHYDRRLRRVVVQLDSRLDISFSPDDVEDLEAAIPGQLEVIEISPSGFGLHFPKLDADLYLPSLLEGFLGSRKWMATRMGAAGGISRSAAKATAARNNGRLGGRPKKKAHVTAGVGESR